MSDSGFLIGHLGYLIGTFLGGLLLAFLVSRVVRYFFWGSAKGWRLIVGPNLVTCGFLAVMVGWSQWSTDGPGWPLWPACYVLSVLPLNLYDSWRIGRSERAAHLHP
jgi:hypothetical protein